MSTTLLGSPEIGVNTLTPREYQTAAIDAAREELRTKRSTLVILPTGTGKTVAFALAARSCVRKGGRVLVIAHREELITQAANVIERAGLHPAVERADNYARAHFEPDVVVASVQTISGRKRLATWPPDYFSLIVCDEAHHGTAETYRRVFEHFRRAKLLGVTATPDRADDDEIAAVFESVAYEMSIWEAMTAPDPGPYLCPLKIVRCDEPIDLRGIRTTGGDFNAADLEERITPIIESLANAIKPRVEGRQAIVFTPDCGSSSAMATALQSIGVRADYVWGDSPDRAEKVAKYQRGETQVLANCMLFTEGFDAPRTSAIVLCRPTKSRSLYCLDGQTEILTEAGWKTVGTIDESERAAAFDLKDGSIHWSPVLATVSRTLQPGESMYGIASASLDIRVSDQHRMVHRTITGRKKVRSGWKFAEADKLAEVRGEFELPVSGFEDAPGLPLTDSQIRFIGWFLTDGGINKVTNAITLYQDHRSPYIEDIKRCLAGCGFKYAIHEESRKTEFSENSTILRFTISKGKPRGTDKHLSGWEAIAPYIDKSFAPALDGLSRVQLGILIDEMNKGDGLKRRSIDWRSQTTSICTGNRTMADRLQSLCVRRGYRCNLAEGDWNANPIYILHIKDEQVRYVGGCNWADRPTFARRPFEPFEPVWCIEVDTGAIVTRRNGKVAIVGNSQMVGRGTRLAPGKQDCVLIDFAWLTDKMDLVRPADLFDRSNRPDDEAEILAEAIEKATGPIDLIEAAERAKDEAVRRREIAVKARAKSCNMRFVSYNALDMANTLGIPVRGATQDATHRPASPKQVETLLKFGVADAATMSVRRATKMLETIFERRSKNLATPKQLTWLVKLGVEPNQARSMTFAEASAFLDSKFQKRA